MRVKAMLSIANLSKRHPNSVRAVFSALGFSIEAGEIVALVGESGVGKSTLLNCIAGLEPADTGAILIGPQNHDIARLDEAARAALRDAAGRLQQFGAGEVGFTPLRHWISPRKGTRYPVQMEIRCGPHRFETVPVHDEQEISARRPLPVSYWEGLVKIRGTRSGRGYLELTGYAGALAL
jgi:energy-coupling factor transporter ATP-binding protein EcfA2